MATIISNCIIEYVGYLNPLLKKDVLNELHYYFTQEEVGEYQVEKSDSHELIVVKVTKAVNFQKKEIYTAFAASRSLGQIKIDIFTTNADGNLSSPSEDPVRENCSKYANEAPKGFVFIEDFTSDESNAYKGIGRGLFQVALEVSKLQKISGKIALQSVRNSPGFYRKMHCESEQPSFTRGIDAELEKAKQEKREPNTYPYRGWMFLKQAGLESWNITVSEKPILYRNNLKNREFGKEAPQNFDSERLTIARRQGESKDQNSETKPTVPKTDSSGCFGITKNNNK